MSSRAVAEMLESAWQRRRPGAPSERGSLNPTDGHLEGMGPCPQAPAGLQGRALRVFNGPTEPNLDQGLGRSAMVDLLRRLAIEVFGEGAWVTLWEERKESVANAESALLSELKTQIQSVLQAHGVKYAVWLDRPEAGVPADPVPLFGVCPDNACVVVEEGMKFKIRFEGVKHPGLFLDHAPLRRWLVQVARPRGRWLNTFAYTGSLSVALARGGAEQILTNDLSAATLSWARENFALNQMSAPQSQVWTGDTLSLLERCGRLRARAKTQDRERGSRSTARDSEVDLPSLLPFDGIVLDPPSFSRSKQGVFSVQKDLVRLQELAVQILRPGGWLVTSINSAKISPRQFKIQIETALHRAGRSAQFEAEFSADPTFGGASGQGPGRITGLPAAATESHGPELKGFALRVK